MKAVIAPPRVPSPSKNQRDFLFADMAKLADALDLGSSEATRAGSSPVIRIGASSDTAFFENHRSTICF